MKNTTPISLPVGAGYLCHGCGHTDGDIMADSTWEFKLCAKCGNSNMLHIEFGRSDRILFIFTWAHGTETYKMNGKMETHAISIYTIDGYDDFEQSVYDDIKLTKEMPVKGIIAWSAVFGMQLTRLDGVKISGFPFGFDKHTLLQSVKLEMLPDHIQLTQKANKFVQRYYMGLVELKGTYARKATWQVQPVVV